MQDVKINLNPILYGGGQERGIRPGTANIPGIVGFGKDVGLRHTNAEIDTAKIRMLRDRLQNHRMSSTPLVLMRLFSKTLFD